MSKYIFRRIISMVITLWLIFTITFVIMHLIPGGPFTMGEQNLPKEILQALNEKYNLDRPLLEQYFSYMKGIATFNLGPSFTKPGVSVNTFIKDGFPISAKLGLSAILIVVVLGIPLGIMAALKQNQWQDYFVTILSTIGVAVPAFIIGTLLLYVFSAKLAWLPAFGLTSLKHYIAPSIALCGYALAFVSRLTRSSMLEVMQQDYIKTARAKGLSELVVICKHALKNSLIPVVTYMGQMIAGIMCGSFVIEKIFAIPGMGKYFVESVTNRDYTVIIGVTVVYATIAVIMIFLVDILYVVIDPRIKLDSEM